MHVVSRAPSILTLLGLVPVFFFGGQEDVVVGRDHVLLVHNHNDTRLIVKATIVIDGLTILHLDPHLLAPILVERRRHGYPGPSCLDTIAVPLRDLDACVPCTHIDGYPVTFPSEFAISSLPQVPFLKFIHVLEECKRFWPLRFFLFPISFICSLLKFFNSPLCIPGNHVRFAVPGHPEVRGQSAAYVHPHPDPCNHHHRRHHHQARS